MYKIQTLNNISAKGLEHLPRENYEIASECSSPDAILLRSYKMHDMDVPNSVIAIGRAGAGVNNIPIPKMTEQGIAVFNAPGANANAVKELVISAMLIASRNLMDAWQYTGDLTGEDSEISKAVEEGKKKFVGFELPGKTLGVVGLGAIGVKIANAAVALGMKVIGFDPSISVQSAWNLSADVKPVGSVDELVTQVDFITFHVPLIEATKNIINAERLSMMKDGVVVMNFARDGIVDDAAVLAAIESGKVHSYVSDFPSKLLKNQKGVVTLPHLGASTGEAEENCAIMVAQQVKDYIENGNVLNSVNFPSVSLARASEFRLAVANENRPDMVGQISHILGENSVNICHMINESRADLAYTLIDVETAISGDVLDKISSLDGVLSARCM